MSTSDRAAPVLALVLVLSLVVAGTACSASLPRSVSAAPILSVATGLYPLAQVAQLIGEGRVHVDDVVPLGADPFTYRPAAPALRSAGLVLEVGGGFQPGIEAAASGARSVLALGQELGEASRYVWLDPATMEQAVASIAQAMEDADPAAAPLFRQNVTAVLDQVASLEQDFSATLSACPGNVLVVPDGALSQLAASHEVAARVVGETPSAAEIESSVSAMRAAPAAGVLSEPWIGDSGVQAVAAAARSKLRSFDTLVGPPAGGWPPGSSYFSLMERNLAALSSALGCPEEGS